MRDEQIYEAMARLRQVKRAWLLPHVTEIAATQRDPFRVLISTVLSLRTQDATTAAASNRLKGILMTTDEELVSSDFNHNPASSTFDLTQTQVVDGGLIRVLSWYDNEWGFSNRMLDTAAALGRLG